MKIIYILMTHLIAWLLVDHYEKVKRRKIKNYLFYFKFQDKKIKIDALIDLGSQVNMILENLVQNLQLDSYAHSYPYPLGWVSKMSKMQVTHLCKLRFSISFDYSDEFIFDIVPLYVGRIELGNPYLFDKHAIYCKREYKYHFVKMVGSF